MNNNEDEENQGATTSKKLNKRKEDEDDRERNTSSGSASTASYNTAQSQGAKERTRPEVKGAGLRGERKERKVVRKRVRRGRVGKPRRSAVRRRRYMPARRAPPRRPPFLSARDREASESSVGTYGSSVTRSASEAGSRGCPRCGHKCCRQR